MAANALVITLISFAALFLAYIFYGRFLAKRVFRLDPNRRTPAHEREDGVDFVPTKVPILFGHHFASIAGLGPILGPAVAVIWGWLPAVLWVVIGSIVLGAVHDLGALTVSLRFKGRSVGDVCRELIGPRARMLFLLVIFFLMSLAMGAFVTAITSLFLNYKPDAIIPSFGLIFVAILMGIAVYKFRASLGPVTVLGLVIFFGLILLGMQIPITTYDWFVAGETRQTVQQARAEGKLEAPYGAADVRAMYGKEKNEAMTQAVFQSLGVDTFPANGGPAVVATKIAVSSSVAQTSSTQLQEKTALISDLDSAIGSRTSLGSAQLGWIFTLLVYGFLASVLPVWLLLQPRDYVNSFQLYFALTFMVIGLVVAAFATGPISQFNHINAPVIQTVADAPAMIPILFVTIACGAISGFHSLVSSGTTVRQLDKETDALPIGYGAMLTEGALAVLVIMACVAGLGAAAWQGTGEYTSWRGISGGGLGTQLNAVINGGGNFLIALGIPGPFARTFLAVTVVSFALTTLDSATRLLRFNVEEIFKSMKLDFLGNRYVASFVAVCGIAAFALAPAGKELWILFGTTNQLLAALTLLTVSLFLYKLNRPVLYTAIPMVLMLVMTIWAMLYNLFNYAQAEDPNYWLITVSVFVVALSFWLLVEGALSFARGRGGLDFEDDEPTREDEMEDVPASARF